MIQLQDVSLAFAGQPLFRRLSWAIRPGERIGLIGPNGAGKTTLLRVITGQQDADAGRVQLGGMTVGYLEQSVQEEDTERSVRAAALDAFHEVLALERREERITDALAAADDHTSERYEKLLHELERVHARLTAREAHTIRTRAEATLTGLGFDPDALGRPLSSFSGGWRMRVALARLLLRRPDVLLLDEPTNHLDIDSIDWLEGYLKSYPGTVVIVSHDRYFLDRMVTSIAELSRGTVTEYAGNYAYYLKERKKRRALQQAAYENQQQEIAEIERFIERFRYKATKAKQVQSRVKKLEKMDRLEPPPDEEAALTLRFPEPRRSGQIVMELSDFSKTYAAADGPVEVFDRADGLTIERGDKVALIGPNGAGKSTLARILRGTEPFEGTRKAGYHVDLAYFAQHQADALRTDHTILESLREKAPGRDTTELRTLLGAFLFTGDDVFKKIGVLSGGEKSRVALARTLLSPANFLILDEPTNHLDIQSRAVLIDALKQYTGAFVVVSHDRHFIGEVARQVWRVGGGRVRTFAGTYAEYEWHREHGTAAQQSSAAAPSADAASGDGAMATPAGAAPAPTEGGGPKSKAQKRREAEARATRRSPSESTYAAMNPYQLRRALDEAEAAVLEKEERQSALEATLADPTLYEDPERAEALSQEYHALKEKMAGLYETWEKIADHLTAGEKA